jgi:hypothetical protein
MIIKGNQAYPQARTVGRMHRLMVNLAIAIIFKRILEAWNSAGNAKRFAKSGGRKIWIARVYHAVINHDRALRKTHGPLTPGKPPRVRVYSFTAV